MGRLSALSGLGQASGSPSSHSTYQSPDRLQEIIQLPEVIRLTIQCLADRARSESFNLPRFTGSGLSPRDRTVWVVIGVCKFDECALLSRVVRLATSRTISICLLHLGPRLLEGRTFVCRTASRLWGGWICRRDLIESKRGLICIYSIAS